MSEPQERLTFSAWTEHYEKEQENQRLQISDLTKAVSSLSADVRTLVENHKSIAARINQPPPLAAYIATIAVVISFATLLITPVKDQLEHLETIQFRETADNVRVHANHENRINQGAEEIARSERDRYWLEKIADHNNEQIHVIREEMRKYHHNEDG